MVRQLGAAHERGDLLDAVVAQHILQLQLLIGVRDLNSRTADIDRTKIFTCFHHEVPKQAKNLLMGW